MTSSLSRRVVILVVAVAALAAEVLLLHWHGVALQSADCDLPTWMQSIVPESPRFVSTLRHMHQSTYVSKIIFLVVLTVGVPPAETAFSGWPSRLGSSPQATLAIRGSFTSTVRKPFQL